MDVDRAAAVPVVILVQRLRQPRRVCTYWTVTVKLGATTELPELQPSGWLE
jgi:hypothetical protein